MNDRSRTADVVIVGAGAIGLGIAWRCAQRGRSVLVVDPAPGSGASVAAAGMLAPVTELHYGEQPLLRLGLDSAARYPSFAEQLGEDSGIDIGYRQTGAVVAAWDGADLSALRDLHRFQTELGLAAELVSGRELRHLEPALAPGLPGGLFAPDDHSVDNRLLHAALCAAVGRSRRVELVPDSAVELLSDATIGDSGGPGTPGTRILGVRTASGIRLTGAITVLAAGAWSARLCPDLAVRPVKGQTVRLRAEPGLLSHTVRGSVKGAPIYAVPRADGTIVVGASSEEAGFDLRPRAGAVYELLRDAQSLVPALSESELLEVSTGLRPGSPDNAPLIGPVGDGLVAATGHYRNGMLLTPVTADGVAALIEDGHLPAVLAPFGPARFAARRADPARIGT
jgi:glycine oxidase